MSFYWNYSIFSVHDHIIKAMSYMSMRIQQVIIVSLFLTRLLLLTPLIVLLERLSSWFGITSTALSWIKSYLLNRTFYVNIENTKSSLFQLLYGVPQGSVRGPPFFILYSTPLTTVISNSSANHHLYADDTQLFLSFSGADFAYNISHLEHTISNVYSWMSSNFLSIPLRLSFFWLVFLINSQNSVILSFIYLIMSLCHLFILLII